MSTATVPPVTSSTVHPPHKVFSLSRVTAIASNTFLELVRLKVFYFLLIFALLLIGSSAFMINFTFQEQFQVLKDVSLGAMSIFTWLLSMLATAMLLPKDIEDRTLYTILAKPVPRFEYLIGKLGGVLLLLLVSTLVLSAMFLSVLKLRESIEISRVEAEFSGPVEMIADEPAEGEAAAAPKGSAQQKEELEQREKARQERKQAAIQDIKSNTFTWSLLPGITCIYLKAALFASLTLLISTFASSWIFTIVTSVAVYFIGTIQSIAREYWNSADVSPLTDIFLKLIVLVFPDLQLFNLVDDIVAGNPISTLLFMKTAALGCIYILVYLFLAYFIFSNKEL